MTTEREKMTAGEDFNQFDHELIKRRILVRKMLQKINNTPDNEERNAMIKGLFADTGDEFFVETDLQFDYGWNIHIGNNFFGNYRLTLMDSCPITFGKNCYIGPNCGLYTNIHPLAAKERVADVELGAPIKIGDNAWFGGGVTILPGVTLGDNVVVGAGAVVTKSFGDNVCIAGNPARVIKTIDNGQFDK
ncbi:sugar O-acetyltransferase [Fructilactobacillus sanfranciscensis]|uniref:sugar O-acetyltransferase n=1 Tax=Fructilactobacillus sanfranciscensis TaxID=1625 RepID=UPI001EF0624A|nr:sugar O-acetyltransferase [Fructilactobacillus sanfranciscensis]MCG7196078.1 sugar O-acetyltransferase [Fructilactobacillus sanfranciscensis]